nr:choice-of-anchor B family protein [Gemmatimonadales bacterium]
GYVYVYRPGGVQGWREVTRIAAPDSALNNGFGRAVAIEGNTLLVAQSPNDSSAAGMVHVYERNGPAAAWRHAGEFGAEGAARGDRFGRMLYLKGDIAIVGATRTDSMRGALFVFRRTGSQWKQEAKIRPEDVKPASNFGSTVSVENDVLLAGSGLADSAQGAAWVYRRDASGGWKMEQKLSLPLLPSARVNARFGTGVLLHNGVAYVGAPGLTQGMGAVLRFTRDTVAKRWGPIGALLPFDVTAQAQFGGTIATVGREIWVGAPNSMQGQGRIFRFMPDTAGFSSASRFGYDTTTVAQVAFGAWLTAANDLVVVGMPNADFGEGRAAILARTATGQWKQQHLNGRIFRPSAVAGKEVQCTSGKAGMFECGKTNMLSMVPIAEMGGGASMLNTVWGWTDPQTGKEIAIVGRSNGTSFVDVSNPSRPRYLGDLPKTAEAPATVWREFKVMHNHVFIVSDGAKNHGMQVFDLTRLRTVRGAPQTFTPDVTYRGVSAAHNVAVDSSTGYVYITGANSGGETCGGGLHMVNAKDPKHLTFAGCFQDMGTGFAGTGYSHDVQCVLYKGPDARYTGREICFGGNETALSVADVTDKAAPKAIGRATYPDFGYIHQGWLTEDQKYLYVNDELDEIQGKAKTGTRTMIFDVSKLDDPVVAGAFIGTTKATDHNLYIRGDRMYQSNYQAGLRIIDISNPLKPSEVGYFDTVPVGDNGPGFGGTWNNYPYFKSGTLLVTSGREGLFVLKDQSTTLTP